MEDIVRGFPEGLSGGLKRLSEGLSGGKSNPKLLSGAGKPKICIVRGSFHGKAECFVRDF